MSFAAAVVPTFPGLSTARSAVSDCAAFASSTPPPSRSIGSSHYRTYNIYTPVLFAPFSPERDASQASSFSSRIKAGCLVFLRENQVGRRFCDDREISNLKKKMGGINLIPGTGRTLCDQKE
jgi:hypothetical protein